MPMYNLLEYSKNYRKTTGSLWNYYRDEPNNPPGTVYNAHPITNSESFKQEKHQTQITKMVQTLSKEIQRLRKILKLLFHKTFKQFLEKFRQSFD